MIQIHESFHLYSSVVIHHTELKRKQEKRQAVFFHYIFVFFSNKQPPSSFSFRYIWQFAFASSPFGSTVWDFLLLTSSTKKSHLRGPMS